MLENTPYTKYGLRQKTQFALKLIKSASEEEVCSWVLRFAHAVEHSFTETDLARIELQHQINDICSSKKDLL